MAPLVERFLVDDPAQGVVGVVPVVGGVFLHPLTREAVQALTVYGAGPLLVKIHSPRILASLPLIPIAGLSHPAQLCGLVARQLGGALQELGLIRDAVNAMGIPLDLERDVLRLRGRVQMQTLVLGLSARHPGELTLTDVGDQALAGRIPVAERVLRLTGRVATDLDELMRLGLRLEERLAALAASPPKDSQEGWGAAGPRAAVPIAAAPDPAPPPAPPAVEEVVELVETVTEAEAAPDPAPEAAAAPPATPPDDSSAGGVKLSDLMDRIGGEAEISAHGGRLRLVVPLKVMQGTYTFYLEQRGRTGFAGTLVSAKGARHRVEFDMATVLDIKDVFDKIVMGKG
jgi:hypothetical protein